MNVILLSGGSGKRLWPLSNDIRSKQFIKIFKNDCGEYESMVQRVYRQLKTAIPDATITIATSSMQVSSIRNQLSEDVDLSIEPCRRDTFPAIALATAFLHDVKRVDEDEAIVVCPVDPYVEEGYFMCLRKLYQLARRGDNNLILMGIQPTYPSEKYGYIIPEKNENGRIGFSFTEKPTQNKAIEYISSGAMWNGGVFAYKTKYVLEKSKEILGTSDYYELYDNYDKLKSISFDYAISEQESSISVIEYDGVWKDLGTWNTLSESMGENVVGKGIISDTCENVHVINELDVPIVVTGVKDVVVSASSEGVLVSDKFQSSFIKPIVDSFDQPVMFADKSWGTYKVIDIGDDSMTIKVSLKPGEHMNYHCHERRDEVWTVICGEGKAIVDGMEQSIKEGDVITMMAGCVHTVIALSELQIIEVQIGKDISVHDKQIHEWCF